MTKYLIDGYNLFFKNKNRDGPLLKEREDFIHQLDKVAVRLQFQALLVFDGKGDAPFSSKRTLKNVEVSFSPDTLSADEYLLELLQWNSQKVTLVTSDQYLLKKSSRLGAETLSVEAFINRIKKKESQTKEMIDKKIVSDSKGNFYRLLMEFEKNLRNHTEL